MDARFVQHGEEFSEEAKLDLEFRQILCIIKSYIPYVNSNRQLTLYRAWLEKLSTATPEKVERNRYLVELARQIKESRISPPFDREPPPGPFVNFPKLNYYLYNPEAVSKHFWSAADAANFSPSCQNLYPYDIPAMSKEGSQVLSPRHVQAQINLENAFGDTTSDYLMTPSRCKKKKTNRTNEPVVSDDNIQRNNDVAEDSSWYDLTDASLASVGQLTSLMCSNIDQTPNNVESLSDGNYETKSVCSDYTDDKSSHQEVKLKDTNFVPTDWRKIIDALQLRLTETLNQNNELKQIIVNLRSELQIERVNKEKYESDKGKVDDIRNRELEMLRSSQEKILDDLKKSHQNELDELNKQCKQQIDEMQESYERQIKDLLSKQEILLKEKNDEIANLTTIIQEQCARISEEIKSLRSQLESSVISTSDERVFVLQKCVSKMDKLFHKSEKEYMKQIVKLKQELELKERVAQIQLKSQRADLISRTSAEKQKQFDEVINNLEIKYIKMLEHHENQVMEAKKQDEEKINSLKQLLHKYDIPYVDV